MTERTKSQGFTLIEIMIATAIMGVAMFAMMSMQTNQMRSTNYLHFQLKRTEIQGSLIGQFLNDANNCGCLFQNAGPVEFSTAASAVTLAVTTPPTQIGRYNFVTAGECNTATVPMPFVDSEGIDGVKATSIQLTNITAIGTNFSGMLTVNLESTKDVLGPKELPINIPVNIATTPGSPGNVNFASCTTSGPAASSDRTIDVIRAKTSYTPAMTYLFGGGGGGGRSISTCGGGTFIYGFSGRQGARIDGLRMHCKNFDNSSTYASNYIGTGGGAAFGLISCPGGSFASGIRGRSGTLIDRFGLECKDTTTGMVTTTTQAGGGGGSLRTFSCPAGSYLFEVRAQHGAAVDSLEIVCALFPL